MPDQALAQLIAEQRKTSGDSYTAIANRGGLPRSTVHKLATYALSRMPDQATLEKLAQGLGIKEEVVTRAAQESVGYRVYEDTLPDSDTQLLMANYERLSPEARDTVKALVNHLLKGM